MAFPQVRNRTETQLASGTTLTCNFGTNVKGDLCIIFIALNDTAQTITTTESFTNWTNTSATFHIIRKVLDGTEGTSTNVTVGTATKGAAIAYTIQAGTHASSRVPAISTVATGTSTGPDATTCSPTGSAKDYLWISAFRQNGEEADDDTWCNSAPTNFTNLVQKTSGTTSTAPTNGSVAAAEYTLNATSLDAGAFNTDQSLAWRAYTIAVYPLMTGSFTANALIEASSGTKTFTLDAVIEKSSGEKTFTANAHIHAIAIERTYTANAVVERNSGTKTFTANAIIKKTITPAGGDTVLFEDTFTRTEVDTWGTSSSGHAWTYISSSPSNFDVNGSEGTITHNGYSRQRQQALNNVTANPVEMYGEYLYVSQPPSLSLLEMYLQLRYENSGTETGYVLRMQHYSGGGTINHLLMHEGTGGYNQMADANSALTSEIGIWWACRFRITTLGNGNVRLQTKVWKKASGEPASWEIDHEDSTYKDTSGDATIETYPGFNFDGTRTYKWDNVRVLEIGTGAGGITIDSIIQKPVSSSFSLNAVIQKTQTGSIFIGNNDDTGGAVIGAGEQTYTFTDKAANAVIKRNSGEKTYTADAVLKKAIPGSLSLNAVIWKSMAGSGTADAVIWKSIPGSATADAVLKKNSGELVSTVDAIVKANVPGSFPASAIVWKSISESFDVAATILRQAQADRTVDAVLKRTQTGSFTASAVLRREGVGGFVAAAVIKGSPSSQFDIAATVLVNREQFYVLDALKFQTVEQSIQVFSDIKAQLAGSFSAHSVLLATASGAFTANALKQVPRASTFSLNAFLMKLVFDDTFTRTTTGGWGPPWIGLDFWDYPLSYPKPFPQDDAYVDGSVGVVDYSGASYGRFTGIPMPRRGLYQFDFYVPDPIPSATWHRLYFKFTESAEFGVRSWTSGQYQIFDWAGASHSFNFTVEPGTWYRAKIWQELPYSGSVGHLGRLKAWKRDDPEPDWQSETSSTYSLSDTAEYLRWTELVLTSGSKISQVDNFKIWILDEARVFGVSSANAIKQRAASSSYTADAVIHKTTTGSIGINAVIKRTWAYVELAPTSWGKMASASATYATADSGGGTLTVSVDVVNMEWVGQRTAYTIYQILTHYDLSLFPSVYPGARLVVDPDADQSTANFIVQARSTSDWRPSLTASDWASSAQLAGETLLATRDTAVGWGTGAPFAFTDVALDANLNPGGQLFIRFSGNTQGTTPTTSEYVGFTPNTGAKLAFYSPTGAFGLNACIATRIFHDEFNRTVPIVYPDNDGNYLNVDPIGWGGDWQYSYDGSNDPSRSGSNYYTYVDGSSAVADAAAIPTSANINYIKGPPKVATGIVRFKAWLPDGASLGSSMYYSLAMRSGAFTILYPYVGSNVWRLRVGNSTIYEFTAVGNSWYWVEVRLGATTSARIWRDGDPVSEETRSSDSSSTPYPWPANQWWVFEIGGTSPYASKIDEFSLWSSQTEWSVDRYFSSRAIKLRPQSSSFTANALIQVPQAGSFALDASITKTIAGTYTAEAVKRKAQSGSFTASALKQVPRTGSLSLNAAIATLIFEDTFSRVVATNQTTWGHPWRINPDYTEDPSLQLSVDGSVARMENNGASNKFVIGYPSLHSGIYQFDIQTTNRTGESTVLDVTVPDSWGHTEGISVQWYATVAEVYNDWGDYASVAITPGDWVTVQAHVHEDQNVPTVLKIWKQGDPEPRGTNARAYPNTNTWGIPEWGFFFNADNPIQVDNFKVWTSEAWKWLTAIAANAIKQREQAGSFTANALIQSTNSGSFSLDASIYKSVTGSYTAAAVKQKAATSSFAVNAAIAVLVFEDTFTRTSTYPDKVFGYGGVWGYDFYSGGYSSNLVSHADGEHGRTWVPAGESTNSNYLYGPPEVESGVLTAKIWIPHTPSGNSAINYHFTQGGGSYAPDGLLIWDRGYGEWAWTWAWGTRQYFYTTEDAWYNIKLNFHTAVNTPTCNAKVWKDGEPEPGWQYTRSNDGLGYATHLLVTNSGAYGKAALIDDYRIYTSVMGWTMRHYFTADAVKQQAQAGAFTAQAIISQTAERSISIDAVIRASTAGALTLDALVATNTVVGAFTADALKRQASEQTFSASAWVAGENVYAFSGDAVKAKTQASTRTIDAAKQQAQAGSLTAEAVVQKQLAGSFSLAAVIWRSISDAFTAQAVHEAAHVAFVSADAVTRAVGQDALVLDAIVEAKRTQQLVGDAVIAKTSSASYTADAVFLALHVGTISLDAVATVGRTSQFSADALINLIHSASATLDAVISRERTGQATVSAFVAGVGVAAFSIDAIRTSSTAGTFSGDALKQQTSVAAVQVDAYVLAAQASTFRADAVIRTVIHAGITVSALISQTTTATFMNSAVVRKPTSSTTTADSIVQRQRAYVWTANAVVQRDFVNTFAASAYINVTVTSSLSVSSVIHAERLYGRSVNAILERKQDAAIGLYATIQTGRASAFTCDAFLLSPHATTFSVAAWIFSQSSGFIRLDSVITRGALPYDLDAVTSIVEIEGASTIRMLGYQTLVRQLEASSLTDELEATSTTAEMASTT